MTIKFYIVGGYVRDRVLGREAKDHDFVVTGATPQDMIDRGFVPIEAQSFPVFHHPVTRDEYALARKERKTGSGYHGFEVFTDPSITIEEDLLRRDLTCNAMAREVIGWSNEGYAKLSDEIIDPYNGREHLRQGVLKHVSEAFAEDPLRVLRVARFAARYNFAIAPDTMDLMTDLVDAGEIDHLTAERVWQEFSKAMAEDFPMQFVRALRQCGAADKLFPGYDHGLSKVGLTVDRAALHKMPAVHRMMWLLVLAERDKLSEALTRMKVPTDESRLITKFNIVRRSLKNTIPTPENVLNLLKQLDAFRRPDDMDVMAAAFLLDSNDALCRAFEHLLRAMRAIKDVSFASLSPNQQATLKGKQISDAIDEIRLDVIDEVL